MYVNMQRNSKWNVFPTPAVRLIIFIQFDFKVINSKKKVNTPYTVEYLSLFTVRCK